MLRHVLKEDVKKFPLIEFKGNITIVENTNDISRYCQIISKHRIIGFDTETKPAFQKGVSHDIALIQLSTNDSVFLFRINKIGLDESILNILTDPNILKVGIDIKNDLSGLKKMINFQECNFLDLNTLAIQKGFKSIGAVKLTIMLLGFRISKRQRLSDWSAEVLTDAQVEYAAIDAWICLKILQAFKDNSLFP